MLIFSTRKRTFLALIIITGSTKTFRTFFISNRRLSRERPLNFVWVIEDHCTVKWVNKFWLWRSAVSCSFLSQCAKKNYYFNKTIEWKMPLRDRKKIIAKMVAKKKFHISSDLSSSRSFKWQRNYAVKRFMGTNKHQRILWWTRRRKNLTRDSGKGIKIHSWFVHDFTS